MKTRVYKQTDLKQKLVQEDIKQTLLNGHNVIFPTETVYGIGAYTMSEKGISSIYTIKGRPSDNPLILHLSTNEDMDKYIKEKKDYVDALIDAYWPGPMTLVFKMSEIVPKNITGGLDTVGIRVPGSDIAREIIDIAGVPICAPSANISGRPSSTLFKHVLEDFEDKVDIIIDGGKSQIGLESTVIDVTGDIPIVLRPGMITTQMIKDVVGDVKISKALEKDDIPKAPGMKYRHYAPKGNLQIVEGETSKVVRYIQEQIKHHKLLNQSVGVIVTKEIADLFDIDHISVIGTENNEAEIASNLFLVLREMDHNQVDFIYSLSFHDGIYGEAIMNRLYKAASQNIKKL